MSKVLHITTHMGGGIGNALSSLVCADIENENTIVLLQEQKKLLYIEKCLSAGIEVKITSSPKEIEHYIIDSDVVIFHWWNHPLMIKVMLELPSVLMKCALWCHVSGGTYPYLPFEFLNLFSKVIFTSQCSYDNSFWGKEERTLIESKSRVIYGLGRLSKFETKRSFSFVSDEVRIAYVGTLLKSKIHPKYVEICKMIIEKNPNVHFYLYGDKEDGEWISEEAEKKGISNNVHLEGFSENINTILLSMDLFGYPLNPYNYATTENSILEALAAGLPVVLLNQGAEKYIVDTGVDGLLADDVYDYVKCVIDLVANETLRCSLGRQAVKDVYLKFNFEQNVRKYLDLVTEMGYCESRNVFFRDTLKTPYQAFMFFLNCMDRNKLLNKQYTDLEYIFKEKTKSSIFQFLEIFPDDSEIIQLAKEIG